MNNNDFTRHLNILGLSQTDAATLLRVTPRSIRRWQKGEQAVPDTVADLLQAWCRLHKAKLPWAADLDAVLYHEDHQLKAYQDHALGLDAALSRVKARGGPAAPWRVELRKRSASLGPVTVSFYPLANGGFSLANYRRRDIDADLARDRQLLEDAIFCIAGAVAQAVEKFGPNWADEELT